MRVEDMLQKAKRETLMANSFAQAQGLLAKKLKNGGELTDSEKLAFQEHALIYLFLEKLDCGGIQPIFWYFMKRPLVAWPWLISMIGLVLSLTVKELRDPILAIWGFDLSAIGNGAILFLLLTIVSFIAGLVGLSRPRK